MESKKRKGVLLIILAVLVFIMMFPVIVTCGVPGYTCTPAPDSNGKITRTNDVEPLVVYVLESISHEDIAFKYFEFDSTESYSK